MTFLNSSLKQLVSGPTVHTLQFECQECDANAFSLCLAGAQGHGRGCGNTTTGHMLPADSSNRRCAGVKKCSRDRAWHVLSTQPPANFIWELLLMSLRMRCYKLKRRSQCLKHSESLKDQRWAMYLLLYLGPLDRGSCLFSWCSQKTFERSSKS